jgi:hypothetical protein
VTGGRECVGSASDRADALELHKVNGVRRCVVSLHDAHADVVEDISRCVG